MPWYPLDAPHHHYKWARAIQVVCPQQLIGPNGFWSELADILGALLLKLWLCPRTKGQLKLCIGSHLCGLYWPLLMTLPMAHIGAAGSEKGKEMSKELLEENKGWIWLDMYYLAVIRAVKQYYFSALIASAACCLAALFRITHPCCDGGLSWSSWGPCRGICGTLDKVIWIHFQL